MTSRNNGKKAPLEILLGSLNDERKAPEAERLIGSSWSQSQQGGDFLERPEAGFAFESCDYFHGVVRPSLSSSQRALKRVICFARFELNSGFRLSFEHVAPLAGMHHPERPTGRTICPIEMSGMLAHKRFAANLALQR